MKALNGSKQHNAAIDWMDFLSQHNPLVEMDSSKKIGRAKTGFRAGLLSLIDFNIYLIYRSIYSGVIGASNCK